MIKFDNKTYMTINEIAEYLNIKLADVILVSMKNNLKYKKIDDIYYLVLEEFQDAYKRVNKFC